MHFDKFFAALYGVIVLGVIMVTEAAEGIAAPASGGFSPESDWP